MRYDLKKSTKEHVCNNCGRLINIGEITHRIVDNKEIFICSTCRPVSNNPFSYRCFITLIEEEIKNGNK